MFCHIPTKSAVLGSISNTDEDAIRHLASNFGSNMGFHTGEKGNLICPCVKVNVPFRVLLPLECSFSSDGTKTGILNPGNYCILYSWRVGSAISVCLRKLGKRESTIEDAFVAWKEDRMIDWTHIDPVKI